MTERKTRRLDWIIVIGLLLGLIFSGCNGTSPASETAFTETAEAIPLVTATDMPIPTATPLPGKVVLISAGMDESTRVSLSTMLTQLVSQSGLQYEERAEFQAAEIGADCKVVVLHTSDAAILEASAAIPATQFIIYTDQELTPSPNQSIIRIRRDKQAFLAGYLVTLMTSDWRAAGLFTLDASGDTEEEAFINGGEYFCGICNPYYAPLVRFPLSVRISANEDASVWQGELDTLLANIIYSVYVSPGSESAALLDSLVQSGLILVGGGDPPEALNGQWAASVVLDATVPLAEIWPDVIAGQGGKSLETSVTITHINEEYLTPGKQLLVNDALAELDSGWLQPLNVPE